MRLQDRKNVPRVRVNGRISEKLQNAMPSLQDIRPPLVKGDVAALPLC
jgi:hypothetical protein